jgi:hypothetical protein
MGSTNKTTNLELSQFIGSDSPKWLTDYNADMQKIDTAVGAVQSQSDATDLVVSGHSTAIESLQATTGEQGTAITGLRTDVNHNAGDISTINSLIGNGEPTTTDKTIIGAINELHSNYSGLFRGWAVQQEDLTICEVTADGTKTYGQLFKELADLLLSTAQAIQDSNTFYQIKGILESDFGYTGIRSEFLLFKTSPAVPDMTLTLSYPSYVDANEYKMAEYRHVISSTIANCLRLECGMTITNGSTITPYAYESTSLVPAAGTKFSIVGNSWKRI